MIEILKRTCPYCSAEFEFRFRLACPAMRCGLMWAAVHGPKSGRAVAQFLLDRMTWTKFIG